MDYIYITEKDKAIIVENQLKELEGNHFALSLIEPSKFQQQDQHLVWQQQVRGIENSIEMLRKKQINLHLVEEE
mgnify:CR=1 FL=1|jgi:hypothetical protein|tara:strand:- start:496 stop:717 length:222 start_codon:yes stop_codon:yes gene_type:complete